MNPEEASGKLKTILDAIAAGRTCEQILAGDPTLSYHDIFHAVAEAPTGFWRRAAASSPAAHASQPDKPAPVIAWHRTD